jgi:hypothetical protein
MSAPTFCTPTRAKKVVGIGTFLIVGANMNLIYSLKYIKEKITGKSK